MLEEIKNFFANITSKNVDKKERKQLTKKVAKDRLHVVLVQDRANISTDFLDLMKQEIIDVIKKYVIVDEKKIDVRFTNTVNPDGSTSAPSLYANVPIINIRNEMKSQKITEMQRKTEDKLEEKVDEALEKSDQFATMRLTEEDIEEIKIMTETNREKKEAMKSKDAKDEKKKDKETEETKKAEDDSKSDSKETENK